jgi:hypothetical protein
MIRVASRLGSGNEGMHFTTTFYRFAAVCSFASALTTLLLVYLPDLYHAGPGFEGRMALVHDPAYAVRSWDYLIHPFLTLMAGAAVAVRIRRVASASALIGLLGFTLWGFTEAGQQTLTLFAFDKWRVAYAIADEQTRAQIRTQVAIYDGLWDSMYFLLLCGFAISHLALGQALVRYQGLTRTVGVLLLLAFVLTLSYMLNEVGVTLIPGAIADRTELFLQPASRTVIGIWLWIMAREDEPIRGQR